MKPNHPRPNTPPHPGGRHLARPAFPLLAALAALALSACGSPEPPVDHGAEILKLEARLDEFGAQLLSVAEHADRAAFWQTVAAFILLAAMIAFVGGAAIGSRARRESVAFAALPAAYPELARPAEPARLRENGNHLHSGIHPGIHPGIHAVRDERPAPRAHESAL